jgi:hypothetical protein
MAMPFQVVKWFAAELKALKIPTWNSQNIALRQAIVSYL